MTKFTSFFPGPSQIHPAVPRYFAEGFEQGIGAISHRSKTFDAISEACIAALKNKLDIPEDYTVLYTNSATQNWEILSQSLIKKKSLHYFSGSFGERWFEYAKYINPESIGHAVDPNTLIDENILEVDDDVEMICLTQNETSNATQIPIETIVAISNKFPETLLAVDLTSSMAGLHIPFDKVDVAYGSMQKCFGLPAGLGLLVLSPKAVAKVEAIGETGRYDSISVMIDKMKKWQTNHTPNVMAIYALMRRMEDAPHIAEVQETLHQRMDAYLALIQELKWCKPFIEQEVVRSRTVVAVQTEEALLSRLYKEAEANNILLGKGYGPYKPYTFRIANFPAHQESDIEHLHDFLRSFKS